MASRIRRSNMLRGMTLVEVMVATAVFTIAFSGLLVGLKMARYRSERGMVQFLTVMYANSLLETIQSYEYEDTFYYLHTDSDEFNASSTWSGHNITIGSFDAAQSGAYADPTDSSPNQALGEERMTLAYHPTTTPLTATALEPYGRSATLTPNVRILGPEDDDVHASTDVVNGVYIIEEVQQEMNVFASAGDGQEKFFFMDDVDDFDGYQEVRQITNEVSVTFEVSVTLVYSNFDDFQYTIQNADGSTVTTVTKSQDRLAMMDEISLADNLAKFTSLNGSDDTDSQNQQMTYSYYNNAAFKKITVKAYYEYPAGSGEMHEIVVDGGKANPRGTLL